MTAGAPLTGPFVADYLLPDGRHYCFILEGPATLEEAEEHLRAIQRGAWIEGGEVIIVKTNILTLWIYGLAVWLKARWLNWRQEARRGLDR